MKKNQNRVIAEKKLPPELHETYNLLVTEYLERSQHHVSDGRKRVNYGILADLVLIGWRTRLSLMRLP